MVATLVASVYFEVKSYPTLKYCHSAVSRILHVFPKNDLKYLASSKEVIRTLDKIEGLT